MAYKGRFYPSNPKKYKGDSRNIIYRSLWERKFMVYCDLNENILEWGSEEIIIPYKSPIDNRWHRYYPDFFIRVKDKSGSIKTYIIEIKPKKQVKEPVKNPKNKTKQWVSEVYTWGVNQAKWEAAKDFCEDKLWEFKILTEDDLGV